MGDERDESAEISEEPTAVAAPAAQESTDSSAAQGARETTEDLQVRLGPHWRRRRFLAVTGAVIALALLLRAFINVDNAAEILPLYLIVLGPLYAAALIWALRTPKALRVPAKKPALQRVSFTNRLSLALIIFIAVYLPITFLSNKIIPYAPALEFFAFAIILFVLYRLVGRAVGVAPSQEALPPPAHRLHKQVVLPIDDPHYQQTLFLNYDFVDKGRGARSLARRLDEAMESLGVGDQRRESILEDLEDYREGFNWSLGLTRRSRERRRGRRERRSQVLRTVYTRFNQELEQTS